MLKCFNGQPVEVTCTDIKIDHAIAHIRSRNISSTGFVVSLTFSNMQAMNPIIREHLNDTGKDKGIDIILTLR
jgi:hypothetical protein